LESEIAQPLELAMSCLGGEGGGIARGDVFRRVLKEAAEKD
jgi:hypothetical protein